MRRAAIAGLLAALPPALAHKAAAQAVPAQIVPAQTVPAQTVPARTAQAQAAADQSAGLPTPQGATLGEVVTTATARPEERVRLTGTVQVIDEARILRSTASSLTDLLAENAVGFFSEWTPGQTSINIRGGATDGQGRDFRSQVLVLINGRRAGTANLSKLSPADVLRIEILRGPASVIYGSQAIGGVINIIMRDGRNSPGGFGEMEAGSFATLGARARYGYERDGTAAYLGVAGGLRGDYGVGGGGREANTGFQRGGATAAVGAPLGGRDAPFGRIDVMARTDGIYDAGFRGSGANTISRDDRENASLDVAWTGATADARLSWNLQGYAVRDQDIFRWASPVIRSGNNPAPGTLSDYNWRTLDIIGLRAQPRVRLWQGNELLLGFDAEYSELRSTRTRVALPGGPAGQVAPYDNNEDDTVFGFYAEDSQRLFDDRLTLRAGIRYTVGETKFVGTPNLANFRSRTADYDATTFSVGATYQALDWLALRTGYSTGFRAPTATELAADFTAVGGGRTFGNPNLKPETSHQWEVGATASGGPASLDLALFQNVIQDRITTRLRSGVANTSDYVNNSGDVVVRGVEAQFNTDLARLFALPGPWRWTGYLNAAWNFDMEDRGAVATLNRHVVERMYRYQGAVGMIFGARDWDVSATGILRGPMYYNTEENLLVPQAEPTREYVHEKKPFWVVNMRANWRVLPNVTLWGAVNNLLDVNQHPIFIGLDRTPYLLDQRFSNGGYGTSMPGRAFLAGLQLRF
ncbi:TonB-dependent receptor [Roseomonas sp. NAR14]|uniref:TonB-dependent receptor n=1 Tax=Roseomonas acroporae TaxID=2937791 RepID=A0A9X1Y4T2_9PROT|nr:TonB-dependent receptor [Roseomonas acroporae]MCK8783070.1 TonB-dependent receptor [Roseomonas acroporae]